MGIDVASITIRNLDDQTKDRLRVRAAHRRRSMEDEARSILREALARNIAAPANLAKAIASRFQPFGGVELELPTRESMREPPQLDP
jgi:plasmid stability protein